ncbi:MAG: DUF4446 family protein [bacterium]|nr:DUF4446 family protein [bacterium]
MLIISTIEILLISGVVFCFVKIAVVRKKSKLFFEGKDGKNLEDLIIKISTEIRAMDEEIQELYNIVNKVHALALRSVHKVGIMRFNPFNDIGGDQSFSIAFLDGKNSGLVISSLHTKEGTRVYSKPIIKGEADKYQLTEEEKNVIKIAIRKKPDKV